MSSDPTIRATIHEPRDTPAHRGGLAPGTVLADRYRIVTLLGKGGMGEVYRADDLSLGVSIAIKVLPEHLADRPGRLERFKAEVRLARDVTHPNVCRVYDVAEAQGVRFLTMEYVDGEDLESLLRRIGRIPEEKAVQMARQLCLGLQAAHERGIVHRDLKPANIMIDGRGNVRIMDFGVAAVDADLASGAAGRAGTPAYMAPEQLGGGEVTRRSDIYSLGLVLHELFTGRAAIAGETLEAIRSLHATGTAATAISESIDPVIHRAISRCLETEPTARPASAAHVAASLPGGDPLAAALAAGETPSPELVAASGRAGVMRRSRAVVCVLACVLFALGVALTRPWTSMTNLAPMESSPEVLRARAREITRALGNDTPAQDWAHGFTTSLAIVRQLAEENVSSSDIGAMIREGHVEPIRYWYRESPSLEGLRPTVVFQARTRLNAPPQVEPRSLSIILSPRGELRRYWAVPVPASAPSDPSQVPAPQSVPEPAWVEVLRLAGVDPAGAAPSPPARTPPGHMDERRAWLVQSPSDVIGTIRVEAGAVNGKIVWCDWVREHDWAARVTPPVGSANAATQAINLGLSLVTVGGIVWGGWFAVRNLRAGRGDRRGAARLAVVCIGLELFAQAIQHDRLASLASFDIFSRNVPRALWVGIICWMLYLALEPLLRKHQPRMLVSWSRLLTGSWRDPLVGRDALVGLLSGSALSLVLALGWAAYLRQAGPIGMTLGNMEAHLGIRQLLGAMAIPIMGVTAMGSLSVFAYLGLCLVTRRAWAAATVVVVVAGVSGTSGPTVEFALANGVYHLAMAGGLMVVLRRSGFLAMLSASVAAAMLTFPMTLDLSSWYAGTSILILGLVGVLALGGALVAAPGSADVRTVSIPG